MKQFPLLKAGRRKISKPFVTMIAGNSGRAPNAPNEKFPPRANNQGGEYSVGIVAGNISFVSIPKERELFNYTQAVMRNNGLIGSRKTALFKE